MVAPGAKKPKGKLDAAGQAALQARREALVLVEEHFRDFDVVWAKVHGFPWWPGVLFHSWDVVRRAGIRTDPKLVATLVVPPPEKILVLDAVTGGETSAYRIRRYCLVMFLDKFNFSVVEIDPRNVASFTAHYQLYERAVMGKKKDPKKTDFRRAVLKATALLHMGEEHTEEDLVMLEEPTPAEKKRRLEVSIGDEEEVAVSLEDVWDDQEADEEAEFLPADECDDKAGKKVAVVTPKNRRKPQTASRSRSQKARMNTAADSKKPNIAAAAKKPILSTKRQSAKQSHVEEASAVDDSIAVVELVTPVKRRQKAPAKESKARVRKASQKEGYGVAHIAVVFPSPSPIDLTNTPESEQKKSRAVSKKSVNEIVSVKPPKARKKKVGGKVTATEPRKERKDPVKALVLEIDGDNDQTANSDADVIKTAEQNDQILTPLSSIWTTAVPGHQRVESHAQLAYKQNFLWDDAVFTDDLSIAEKEKAMFEREQAELAAANSAPGRERALGKRQPRSVQQSQIRQNLMTGNLDPHTMVQCAAYRPKNYVEDPNNRSRGGPTLDPPFQVLVHPDVVFVADLHAHLATCEIIGFLGGKWDESANTLYIQAAFPCRSLEIDGDDGSTDVEMDPGSEIELRGIIENAHLEVVGWYHSHPAFAPDPSVRDIENQTSYQQLFQRPSLSKRDDKEKMPSEPFVGLIVGTYDTRRSTPVSLFRYFHVRGEKVSGSACREIHMPYEFIPERRHFRSVLKDEERQRIRSFSVYPSVLQHFALKQSFFKPEQLQSAAVVQATLPRRSSPTRVKVQGPIRKRKQSTEAVDKPVKKAKAKAKGRRSSRSSPAAPMHVDLTGDNDDKPKQILQPSRSEATNTEQVNTLGNVITGVNRTSNMDVTPASDGKYVKMDTPSDGAVADKSTCAVDVVQRVDAGFDGNGSKSIVSTSKVLEDKNICANGASTAAEIATADIHVDISRKGSSECKAAPSDTGNCDKEQHEVANRSKQLVHIVEPDSVEIVADVTSSSNRHKTSRKSHQPRRVAECCEVQKVVEEVDVKGETPVLDKAKNTGKAMNADVVEVDARGPTTGDSVQSSSLSSLVKRGVSPATSVCSSGSAGRKRNRKPRKPMKNSNRSASPNRDGPSPRRSPSPSNGFYDAFHASGPRISSGGSHDEFSQQSSRVEGPKQDTLLVEDMRYIVVEEKDVEIAASNASNGNPLSGQTFDKETQDVKTETQADSKPKLEVSASSLRNAKHAPICEVTHTPPHPDEKVKVEPAIETIPESMVADGNAVMKEERFGNSTYSADKEAQSFVSCLVERAVVECVAQASSDSPTQHGAGVTGKAVPNLPTPADKIKNVQKHQDGTTSANDSLVPVQNGGASAQDVNMITPIAQVLPSSSLPLDTAPRLLNEPTIGVPMKGDAKIQAETEEFGSTSVQDASMAEKLLIKNEAKRVETVASCAASGSGISRLFGNNCECEDIQTSLQKMSYHLNKLRAAQTAKADQAKPLDTAPMTNSTVAAPASQIVTEPTLKQDGLGSAQREEQVHLTALRTKYGPGMSGCTEQVITLVDYYRRFERRTELSEIWKSRITKLEKIQSSLSEYVQFLNMPVSLRHDFVKDLIAYLRVSWRVDD